MWSKFLKKWKKNNYTFETMNDIQNDVKMLNREIIIENLTPQISNQIDSLIRAWNLIDEYQGLLISDREPIKLYINSLGGDLIAALTLIDAIRISKTPVYTFNIGTAQKEAFLVFLSGHRRYTYSNSTFMYNPSDIVPTIDINGNESTFFNLSTLREKRINEIQNFIIEKTSLTENNFEKNGKTIWWFDALDAIKLHICHEVNTTYYFHLKTDDKTGRK